MEIAFCDRCDASIPRADLDRGAARAVAGELLCAACRASLRRDRAGSLAIAALALLAAAAIGAVAAVLVLRPRIGELETKVAELSGTDTAPRTDPALIQELTRILDVDREQSRAIRELQGTLVTNSEDLARAIDALTTHVVHLADEIRAVKESMAAAPAPEAGTAPEPAKPPEAGGAEPGAEPEVDLDTWLSLIDDANAGVRLSALLAIARSTDERVDAKLLEALADPDSIVRSQAARALGERGVVRAVPALVDRLEDRNIGVRKEAHAALLLLGVADHGYDVTGSEEDRATAVKAIRKSLAE